VKKIIFLIDNIHPSLGGLSSASKSILDLYAEVVESKILYINNSENNRFKFSNLNFFFYINKLLKHKENIFIVHGYFSLCLLYLIFYNNIKLYCYTHGMLHVNALKYNKKSIFFKYVFSKVINYFGNNVIFIALSEKESIHIKYRHPKNKVIIIENALT
jgi:hypothetical protein